MHVPGRDVEDIPEIGEAPALRRARGERRLHMAIQVKVSPEDDQHVLVIRRKIGRQAECS